MKNLRLLFSTTLLIFTLTTNYAEAYSYTQCLRDWLPICGACNSIECMNLCIDTVELLCELAADAPVCTPVEPVCGG